MFTIILIMGIIFSIFGYEEETTKPPTTKPPTTKPPTTKPPTTKPPEQRNEYENWKVNYESYNFQTGINKIPLPSNLKSEKLKAIIVHMFKIILYTLTKFYAPLEGEEYKNKKVNQPHIKELKLEIEFKLQENIPEEKNFEGYPENEKEYMLNTALEYYTLAKEIYEYFFIKQVNGDEYTWSIYEIHNLIKFKLDGLYTNIQRNNSLKLVLISDTISKHDEKIDDFMIKSLNILKKIFKKTCENKEVISNQIIRSMDIYNPRMHDMLKSEISKKVTQDMILKGEFTKIDEIINRFFVDSMTQAVREINTEIKSLEIEFVSNYISELLNLIVDFSSDLNTNHIIRISEDKKIIVIAKNWEMKMKNVLELLCNGELSKIEFVKEVKGV